MGQDEMSFPCRGGGVVNNGMFKMFGGSISDNMDVQLNGGGVLNSAGSLTLASVEVQGNQAQQGGGIYVNVGKVTLRNVTISPDSNGSKNGAARGGGMYVSGGTVKMSGGGIYSNTATTIGVPNAAAAGGGGLYVNGGTVTLTDAGINYNGSRFNGGGVFVRRGRLVLTKDLIGENASGPVNGGGNGGGMFINTGSVVVNGGTFEDNSASNGSGYGGGIFNNAGSLTLNSDLTTNAPIRFVLNSAKNGGGGMCLASNSTTVFNGVNVTNNKAPTGPGVYEQMKAFVRENSLTDNDDPGGTPYRSGIA